MKNSGNTYNWQALLIVTILMLVSIFILIGLTQNNITNNIIPLTTISLFFILVGIYVWYLYICNVIFRPKKEILYLVSKEKRLYEFYDKKGKRYFYSTGKIYEINKFYIALKTKDNIKSILEPSEETFELLNKKEGYWLNFYSPVGNYENIFLLPIIYLIFIIGLSLLFTFDFNALIMVVLALYLIIYDLIYKIKKKRNKTNEVIDDTNLKNSFRILVSGIKILSLIIVFLVSFYIFHTSGNIITKLFILPFSLFVLLLLIEVIALSLNYYKLVTLLKKIYKLLVITYFIVFLAFLSFICIKNKDYSTLLITIPFWIVFIGIIYKNFINKK